MEKDFYQLKKNRIDWRLRNSIDELPSMLHSIANLITNVDLIRINANELASSYEAQIFSLKETIKELEKKNGGQDNE